MERPEDIKAPRLLKGEYIAVSIVIIFHIVGIIGLCMPSLKQYFLAFVPWHLLFMFIIILFSHRHKDEKFILFVIIILILGYAAEWIGIHTHQLFGNYAYGKTLGIKLTGVPLIVAVNWFLLTYSTSVSMQHTRITSTMARVLLGAILLVALDLFIEPVAIRFDYWHWVNHAASLSNYICWFLISSAMLLIFEVSRFKKQGPVAAVFLACQFVFFGILYGVGR